MIHLNEVGAKVGVDLLIREKARERVVVEDGARHLAVDDALDGKANAAEVRASHLVLGNVQRRISLRVVGRFVDVTEEVGVSDGEASVSLHGHRIFFVDVLHDLRPAVMQDGNDYFVQIDGDDELVAVHVFIETVVVRKDF